MIRQYRIERFNGVEVLVCECFRKHTWTQAENDALFRWREETFSKKHIPVAERFDSPSDFRAELDDFLSGLRPGEESTFFGLSEPIPVFEVFPSVVLRGAVINNRIASLQVDYTGEVLDVEIVDEVRRFYGVMDSRHWRDMVAHQIEKYGTLFTSEDD